MSERHLQRVQALLDRPDVVASPPVAAALTEMAIRADGLESLIERMATELEGTPRTALSLSTGAAAPSAPSAPSTPSDSARRARQWREKRRVRERPANDDPNAANGETNAANAETNAANGSRTVNERGENFGVARAELPRDVPTDEGQAVAVNGEKQWHSPTPQGPTAFPPLFGETEPRAREQPANAETNGANAVANGEPNGANAEPNAEPNAPTAEPNGAVRTRADEDWDAVAERLADPILLHWLVVYATGIAGEGEPARFVGRLRDALCGPFPRFTPTHVRQLYDRDQRRPIDQSVEGFMAGLADVYRQQAVQEELLVAGEQFRAHLGPIREAIRSGRRPPP